MLTDDIGSKRIDVLHIHRICAVGVHLIHQRHKCQCEVVMVVRRCFVKSRLRQYEVFRTVHKDLDDIIGSIAAYATEISDIIKGNIT